MSQVNPVIHLCLLNRRLPKDLVDKIVHGYLLKSWSTFTGMPWNIQQDIILLRPLSAGQGQDESLDGYRGLFKVAMPTNHSGFEGYWVKDRRVQWRRYWAKDRSRWHGVGERGEGERGAGERPDFRFNRTNHEWEHDSAAAICDCCPGGCGDPDCGPDQEPPSEEEVNRYNEQSNWSNIEILNHIRSVECPSPLPSSLPLYSLISSPLPDSPNVELETKDQDKLSFSNMIDDIIYEMEDREEWSAVQPETPALAAKSCNLLWCPTIGGPGYIQIIHAEVW